MSSDVVYFDLETQRTANDAGGWDRKRDMGMSIGVTYSTKLGEYRIYGENRVEQLVQQLLRADLVVGFNVINFDYEVLMGYTAYDLPHLCHTLDLMVDIEKKLGHRLGLDAVASASIGVGKTGDGLDAIRWWREGRVLEIAEYCCFDVKCTKLVHEFGIEKKKLFYTDRFQQRKSVPVEWNAVPCAALP
ncbi:MAG: ribonuclease H-like domain-containing protein [Chthoniobacter sp.]|uniref:ribonuclease H-like domain-containing protein n=1 Tax=Chthoniobacter sp. TaxID=2510640 RepID=UPI0032A433EA